MGPLAIGLYRKNGFKECKPYYDNPMDDVIYMIKNYKITASMLNEKEKNMKIDASSMEWTRKPKSCQVTKDKVEIITEPHTDLWQRTYYHFRNDNAPVL